MLVLIWLLASRGCTSLVCDKYKGCPNICAIAYTLERDRLRYTPCDQDFVTSLSIPLTNILSWSVVVCSSELSGWTFRFRPGRFAPNCRIPPADEDIRWLIDEWVEGWEVTKREQMVSLFGQLHVDHDHCLVKGNNYVMKFEFINLETEKKRSFYVLYKLL
jgi:hypothetical protein